jgi:D-alanyl-lipoteichoic acid acyltransferase DltB (MBOAT superfamily)
VLCYALQLYFDFSGYSDMALGLARMVSITLPVNFNSPYKAASIIDFWQRWHMTLTRWLNVYLYNPIALGMSRRRVRSGRKANRKAQRTWRGFGEMIGFPLTATMFLAGVWHGAGMQFVLFGLAHAVYLSVNHGWRTFVEEDSPWQRLLPVPVCMALTFASVLVGQVFFRAGTALDAWYVLGTLAGLHGGAGLGGFAGESAHAAFATRGHELWPLVLAIFAVTLALPNTQEILGQAERHFQGERTGALRGAWLRWQPNAVWAIALIVLTTATLTLVSVSTSFLYFQF